MLPRFFLCLDKHRMASKGEKGMLKQQTGRSPNLPKAVGAGVLTALTAAFLGAALLAKLVDMELLKMENLGYGILVLHLLSVFLGAGSAMVRGGHRASAAGGITGAGYYLVLLLVNGLFFGGSYSGLGVTLLLTVLAVGAAMLTHRQGRGRGRRKRYKIPK